MGNLKSSTKWDCTPDSFIAKRDKGLSVAERKRNAAQMEPKIKTILAGIDDKGRWINNDMITCKDFVMNVNMLCDYLELSDLRPMQLYPVSCEQ